MMKSMLAFALFAVMSVSWAETAEVSDGDKVATEAAATDIGAEQSSQSSLHSSPQLTPQQQAETLIADADWLALVEITHVNSLINRAMSFTGALSVEGYTYQMAEQRRWKGEITQGTELRVSLRDCHHKMDKGETYLVAARHISEELVSGSCDQLVAVADAEQLIAHLDRLIAPSIASR
ncbi:hypothetical protein HBA55_20735 [Pseudomaricurvus alkylphenolicus]|uniref:hypothetical protein n=1 Tax=Pseudomaricurvus alkylphenolicus TaxID=1306991 RepID=UPI001423134D|nr:hypothetical protein [Pseudomaricurvus alkylphenolicus]NIB42044.1 hypothetical protein [Pseudomaricurvus alkylphenolicus]